MLPLLPAQARSIGPSAGLLNGSDGCVVFVFGLATFRYAHTDEVGRRLAAVQLVSSKIATSIEVASAFEITTVTLWRWGQDFTTGGVTALVRGRTGPKGPNKLTAALTAQIVSLDAAGLSLRKIAARTAVSTATVRVALGRVTPPVTAAAEPADTVVHTCDEDIAGEVVDPGEAGEAGDLDVVADLVVLAEPVPRVVERAAARSGELVEAPVVITEGDRLPLVGCCWRCPPWR